MNRKQDQLEINKRNVMGFYDIMFNGCKPREAIEAYVGDVYIQHNAEVADGKEAFIAYFTEMAKEYPGKRVEFKRAIAEGNYVAALPSDLAGPAGLCGNRHFQAR
jgi:predicted SnoaL-like aldol condensation-catalyzing enzyme